MKTRTLFFAALLGLSSAFSFAQNAALTDEQKAAVQKAAQAGDTAAVAQIAAANPNSAATVAGVAASANPSIAAAVAQAVVQASPSIATAVVAAVAKAAPAQAAAVVSSVVATVAGNATAAT